MKQTFYPLLVFFAKLSFFQKKAEMPLGVISLKKKKSP